MLKRRGDGNNFRLSSNGHKPGVGSVYHRRGNTLQYIIAAVMFVALATLIIIITKNAISPHDGTGDETSGTDTGVTDYSDSGDTSDISSEATSESTSEDTETATEDIISDDISGDTSDVTSDITGEVSGDDSPAVLEHEYGSAVPLSDKADISYLDGAVFFGDSRTEGLWMYSGLTNSIFISERGLNVSTALNKALDKYDSKTAFDELSETPFDKIYISFGINEIGWIPSVFATRYGTLIEKIKELNPDADIYIENIYPMTAEADAVNTYGGNNNLWILNDRIADLCREHEVYLIDLASYFSDSDGNLDPSHKTGHDGQHFHGSGDGYKLWIDYLLTHTVKE